MEQHLLVCLSAAPSNRRVIETAAGLAKSLGARLTALYVETSYAGRMTKEEKKSLEANRKLAEQAGAKTDCVFGDDVGFQIAEYARKAGVTKIIMGRSNMRRRSFYAHNMIVDRIMELRPEIDIFIIPDGTGVWYEKRHLHLDSDVRPNIRDTAITAALLALATVIGFGFEAMGLGNVDVIPVYIVSVLVTTLLTNSFLYCAVSLMAAVLLFDFFFVLPKYTLATYGIYGTMTLIILFVCLSGIGFMTLRMKKRARISAQMAYRTKVILEANQIFRQAESREEVVKNAADILIRLFGKTVVFFPVKGNDLDEPEVHFGNEFNGDTKEQYLTGNELAAAQKVFLNGRRAGATTDTIPEAKCLYLAARGSRDILAVVGIAVKKEALTIFESNLAVSVLGECALALERLDGREEGLL